MKYILLGILDSRLAPSQWETSLQSHISAIIKHDVASLSLLISESDFQWPTQYNCQGWVWNFLPNHSAQHGLKQRWLKCIVGILLITPSQQTCALWRVVTGVHWDLSFDPIIWLGHLCAGIKAGCNMCRSVGDNPWVWSQWQHILLEWCCWRVRNNNTSQGFQLNFMLRWNGALLLILFLFEYYTFWSSYILVD